MRYRSRGTTAASLGSSRGPASRETPIGGGGCCPCLGRATRKRRAAWGSFAGIGARDQPRPSPRDVPRKTLACRGKIDEPVARSLALGVPPGKTGGRAGEISFRPRAQTPIPRGVALRGTSAAAFAPAKRVGRAVRTSVAWSEGSPAPEMAACARGPCASGGDGRTARPASRCLLRREGMEAVAEGFSSYSLLVPILRLLRVGTWTRSVSPLALREAQGVLFALQVTRDVMGDGFARGSSAASGLWLLRRGSQVDPESAPATASGLCPSDALTVLREA